MPDERVPHQPADREPVAAHEDERLAVPGDAVPQGPIHDWPERRHGRRFAYAVPVLLVMIGVTLLAEIAVIVAGVRGYLTDDYVTWFIGVPLVTFLATAFGALAANAGWLSDRSTGIARPVAYGLLAGVGTIVVGFGVLTFVSVAMA